MLLGLACLHVYVGVCVCPCLLLCCVSPGFLQLISGWFLCWTEHELAEVLLWQQLQLEGGLRPAVLDARAWPAPFPSRGTRPVSQAVTSVAGS